MNYIFISNLWFILIKFVIGERGLSITNYTIDFFEKLSVERCYINNDCPDYSNGCYIPQHTNVGYCNIYMFCHEADNCLKLSLGEFNYEYFYRWPYYKTDSYDIHNLTMNSCNLSIKNKITEINEQTQSKTKINVDKLGSISDENGYDNENWGIFEDCKYQDCSQSKCFSGKCNKDQYICEINESKPAYVCTLSKDDTNLNYSVKCLLMNHEPCNNNSECLSNICDTQAKICVTVNSKLTLSETIIKFFKDFWVFFLLGLFLILIIIIIVYRGIKNYRNSKKIVFAKMDY